ncbi:MSHA biogenesis protein MshJ [Shewanella algae]|uniref:MSHA biogenesis protein MshJ n=1 Tax=Shewanella algae TaxID=38313 RepID=A0A7T8EF68_9GAMM|nr:MSHA biogenesis protein MshJ [Shewanella algae]
MNFLRRLGQAFDGLSQRERIMVAGVSLLLLLFLLYLPLESFWLERQSNLQRLHAGQSSIKLSQQQLELYRQRLAEDPDTPLKARLGQVNRDIAALDQQLDRQMVDMVPASYMPSLLSALLERVQGIQLTGFKSVAPTPLLVVGKADEQQMNLYSHGIVLEFEGDYFAVLKFVQAVENMPDKLYWKRLDYRVSEYPKASVQLELYTLSINEDFISVASSS